MGTYIVSGTPTNSAILDAIARFRHRTEEEQYTDVGDAWDLFDQIEEMVRIGLQQELQDDGDAEVLTTGHDFQERAGSRRPVPVGANPVSRIVQAARRGRLSGFRNGPWRQEMREALDDLEGTGLDEGGAGR